MKLKMKIFISFMVLSFMTLGILSSSSYIRANDEKSGYIFGVKERDGPGAEIVGDMSKLHEGVTITTIITPQGEELNPEGLVYNVSENGDYTFIIKYKTDSGEYQEEAVVKVETIPKATEEVKSNIVSPPTLDTSLPKSMTKEEFNQRKRMQSRALSEDISVDAFNGNSATPIHANLNFVGGEIDASTAPTVTDGIYSYNFEYAELRIEDMYSKKTYRITFLSKLDGILYYGLSDKKDTDIVYQVPDGSAIAFIYSLDTTPYDVAEVLKPDTSIDYVRGVKDMKAHQGDTVVFDLTYSSDYNTNESNGTAIQAIINDGTITPVKVSEDKAKRIITYSFTMPNGPVKIEVAGDHDTASTHKIGLVELTGRRQAAEKGEGKLETYVDQRVAFGLQGTLIPYVIAGSSVNSMFAGVEKKTAVGTYTDGAPITLKYEMSRYNSAAGGRYYYYPSSILSYDYFPVGESYESGTPVNEAITLYDPSWVLNQTYTQVAADKTKFDITITAHEDNGYNGYRYEATIIITGAKRDIRLSTQSTSSAQTPHTLRSIKGISTGYAKDNADNILYDSILKRSDKDNTASIKNAIINPISTGLTILEKNAGGYSLSIPGIDSAQRGFEYYITPKWGYAYPIIESYDRILEKKVEPLELQLNSEDLLASGFNSTYKTRDEISPFTYVNFMDVSGVTHAPWITDLESEMIRITVKTDTGAGSTTTEEYNLIDKNIYKIPESLPTIPAGKSFVGYKATLKPLDNKFLDASYTKVLYKNDIVGNYLQNGDVIDIADFYRKYATLLEEKKKNGTLNEEDNKLLLAMMWSSKYELSVEPVFTDGNVDGAMINAKVDTYLQDMTKQNIAYSPTSVKTTYTSVISGTKTFLRTYDEIYPKKDVTIPYTGPSYLVNKRESDLDMVMINAGNTQIAKLRYDRIMNVSYDLGASVTDETVKKRFKDKNNYTTTKNADSAGDKAKILYPTNAELPKGKRFVEWKIEVLDDSGNWVNPVAGAKQKLAPKEDYTFSSGVNGQHQSIKLTAVWSSYDGVEITKQPKDLLTMEGDPYEFTANVKYPIDLGDDVRDVQDFQYEWEVSKDAGGTWEKATDGSVSEIFDDTAGIAKLTYKGKASADKDGWLYRVKAWNARDVADHTQKVSTQVILNIVQDPRGYVKIPREVKLVKKNSTTAGIPDTDNESGKITLDTGTMKPKGTFEISTKENFYLTMGGSTETNRNKKYLVDVIKEDKITKVDDTEKLASLQYGSKEMTNFYLSTPIDNNKEIGTYMGQMSFIIKYVPLSATP